MESNDKVGIGRPGQAEDMNKNQSKDCFVVTLKCYPDKADRKAIDRWFARATAFYNAMLDRTLQVFGSLLDDEGFKACWEYGFKRRRAARLEFALKKLDAPGIDEETGKKVRGMHDELDKLRQELADTRRKYVPDADESKAYSACYRKAVEKIHDTEVNKPEQLLGYARGTFSKFGFISLAAGMSRVFKHEGDEQPVCMNGINSGIAAALAERLWAAWNDKLAFKNFGKGVMVRRKSGVLRGIKFKNNCGVTPDVEGRVLHFRSKEEGEKTAFDVPFKIRRKDTYMLEALDGKTPVHTTLKLIPMYPTMDLYVQFTLYGRPPSKGAKLGNGRVGLDLGPDSVTAVSKDRVIRFDLRNPRNLASEETRISQEMDRLDREANPDNYNPDGTFKKGCRNVHSEEYNRLSLKLAHIRRQLVDFRKNVHGRIMNRAILSMGSEFVTEDDPVKEWQERSDEPHGPTGTKKRNGSDILVSAPAEFMLRLERKAKRLGGSLRRVPVQIAASQFDFSDGTFTKHGPEDTFKLSNGGVVDKDAIAAFNLRHVAPTVVSDKRPENYDVKAMKRDWKSFEESQSSIELG